MSIKSNEKFQAGDKIQFECFDLRQFTIFSHLIFSEKLKLKWSLNGRLLGFGETNIWNDFAYAFSIKSFLRYTLTADDHGKILKCFLDSSIPSSEPEADQSIQLFVNSKPEIVVEVISKIEAGKLGKFGPIIVTANPKPQFEWFVNGKLLTSSGNEKFVASSPIQIDTNRFSASLSYNSLSKAELNPKIELKATNKFGSFNYVVKI